MLIVKAFSGLIVNALSVAFIVLLTSMNTRAETPGTNIIFVIGDGMGAEYISAYRYFKHQSQRGPIANTLFDDWLSGSVSTYPYDTEVVTDSAASGTALATGVKTHNEVIGLDHNFKPQPTALERAREHGYSTGIVVTSQINHATPASFLAHVKSRNDYNDIADQYFDRQLHNMPYVDLLFGGGKQYFMRPDRNLVEEFQQKKYQYIDSWEALTTLNTLPALALFADTGMPHAIDSEEPLRLAKMTKKALSLFPDEKPFFLLVEASEIDWCGHANDIACAMAEMTDTEATLKVIKTYVDAHPNTVVVVTADHSTGGLSIGANGHYLWKPTIVAGIQRSVKGIANQLIIAQAAWLPVWTSNTKITLDIVKQALITKHLAKIKSLSENTARQESAVTLLVDEVRAIINNATSTGWTTRGHTGGDVPLMAYGRYREKFQGHMDNTDIARTLFSIIH